MTFDKQLLLTTFAPRVVPITVEYAGKAVDLFVRELSARQVFDLQAEQKKALESKTDSSNEAFTDSLIARALCDEDGKSVMTSKEVRELAEMQVRAFNNLAEAVAVAVGLTIPKKKEGEEEVPNV